MKKLVRSKNNRMICGVCGGIIGKAIHKKISTSVADKLYILLIYVILGLCLYNIIF